MIQPITPEELQSINKYRRSSASAFLTIMFTSIKNFSQIRKLQGIEYIKTILALHDTLLEDSIEKDGAGMVAKRIDDSYVGVFASPAIAIDRAMQIQASLKKINDAHPELENIEIMIGLETGQVTVGDEINVEIFNYHLKRSYALQNLADGKQIFLGFSPEDWFFAQQNKQFAWKSHGKYHTSDHTLLMEIYEVADKEICKITPPNKGKKLKTFPWMAAGIGLLLLAMLAGGFFWVANKTAVWFVHMPDTKIFIDQKDQIILDGTLQNTARKCLRPITPGRHILHYDIHYQVKYYAEIDIAKGKNYIDPKFSETRLPDLSRRLDLNADNDYTNTVTATKRFQYITYTKSSEKKSHQVIIELTIKGHKATEKPDPIIFEFLSSVTLDGKVVHEATRSIPSSASEKEPMRVNIPIYNDEEHYYFLSYGINHPSAELTIGAAYIEYMKPAKE
ncbi:hypothetical protein K8S19_12010 [bacterium]|nr:hypothetical protein [bacterium]